MSFLLFFFRLIVKTSNGIMDEIWNRLLSTHNEGGDVTKLLADYAKESGIRDDYLTALAIMV